MNLPELAERDATGEQAAIYAEIRRLGGVPMVALIFRHLATLPGALEGEIASLPPEVAALLKLMAAPGEPGSPRVVQSLYRHFTHRPAFLAFAVTLLRQRFDDGSIVTSVTNVHSAMSRAADGMVTSITVAKAPHPGIETVCTRFAGAVIPQMIVVGRLLDDALAAA